MAVEIFMKMDGVAGGSRNYHHRGSAEVLSWSWGLNRSRSTDGTKFATKLNEIAITKGVGVETPALMTLCAAGTVIPEIELSVVPVVGKREAQQKYVVITLTDVVIKSINTGGNVEDGFIREKIALHFKEIKYEFFGSVERNPTGTDAEPECYTFGWDVPSNSAR